MRCFGIKEFFAIEYEMLNMENGYFEMWVDSIPICCFIKDNTEQPYNWDLSFVVEWLSKNIPNVLKEIEFPLPIKATTAIEFYNKSGDYDFDDINEFNEWFDKRQDWYFGHSWYSNRAGSYLAEVFFRRVGDMVEIEWDNTNLYDGVVFVNPKGLHYIKISLFEQVVSDFISDYIDKNCK